MPHHNATIYSVHNSLTYKIVDKWEICSIITIISHQIMNDRKCSMFFGCIYRLSRALRRSKFTEGGGAMLFVDCVILYSIISRNDNRNKHKHLFISLPPVVNIL